MNSQPLDSKGPLDYAAEDTSSISRLNKLANSILANYPDRALTILEPAITQARERSDSALLFDLLFTKILSLNTLNRHEDALIQLAEAEAIAASLNDVNREASALKQFGLCYQYLSQYNMAISYFNQALQRSREAEDTDLSAEILRNLGGVYSNKGSYYTAAMRYQQALDLQIAVGNEEAQAHILMNMGNNLARSGQLAKALQEYSRGISVAREAGDKNREAIILRMMGYSCYAMGVYPEAIEYFQQSLVIAEEYGFQSEMAELLSNLADVYIAMEEYGQAIIYVDSSQVILSKNANSLEGKHLLVKKGEINTLMGNCEAAIGNFLQALDMVESSNDDYFIRHQYFNLGKCYHKLDSLEQAIYYLTQAEQKANATNDLILRSEILLELGKIHQGIGNTERALNLLRDSYNTADLVNNLHTKLNAARALYLVYREQRDYEQAVVYLEQSKILQDSLLSEKNFREIGRLEAQFSYMRERDQITFSNNQQRNRQRFIQIILFLALVITAIITFFFAWLGHSKQRANNQLKHLNEEIRKQKEQILNIDQLKDRFFTNISHELRTPLTIIGGMTNQIEKAPDRWLSHGLALIRRNTDNLLNLVNQIMELSILKSDAIELHLIQTDIITPLRLITESFQTLAKSKGIRLHFLNDEKEVIMDFDQEKILRITSNLFSNAIKFTPSGGDIYLSVERRPALSEDGSDPQDQYLLLTFRDTGVGIPAEKQHLIFNRFFQVDEDGTHNKEGFGIGLELVYELVKVLDGSINMESEVGKGTTFWVRLPIRREAEVKDTMVSQDLPSDHLRKFIPHLSSVEVPVALPPTHSEKAKSANKLLIIEDNPEILLYLESLLAPHYKLEMARNGQEGIDLALKIIPDLIISDVMMPGKNGFEVCEILKTDECTSHIPIVLLTARADVESRIAGFSRGADAYLAKPFHEKELLIRLEKLLELRERLQQRYQSLAPISPTEDPNLQQEDAFICKLRGIIEKNMENSDFSIPELCKAIGMSRSQLHLKIKALTKRSTSYYIHSIRLHKAKDLLGTKGLTVTQVAYEVGFKDPAYFSRLFTKEFGISPNKYLID